MNTDIIRNRKKVIIGLILLALIGIPLTVFLALKQQETRSRASGGGVQFELSPQAATKNPGETFTVDVNINAGTYSLSGLDTSIKIDNNIIDFVSFTPAPTFDTVIINNYSPSTGVLRITAVNTENPPLTGTVKVGTLTLKAKAGTGTGAVTVQTDAQVVASGQETPLPIDASINGSYTIVNNPTENPTAEPSSPPNPTSNPTTAPTETPTPTGSLAASPNPCTIPWNGVSCTSTISWNAINTDQVTVKLATGQDIHTGLNGSTTRDWITDNTFILYDTASGKELDRLRVYGNKQPAPTETPTPTSAAPPPTQTPVPGKTNLSLVVGLDGIGKTDRLIYGGGNFNPKHPARNLSIKLLNASDNSVAYSINNQQFSFNPSSTSGKFSSVFSLPDSFQTGIYNLYVSGVPYLIARYPGSISITKDQTTILSSTSFSLTTGDINKTGNSINKLDFFDYNVLLSCSIYSTDQTLCNSDPGFKQSSDLNDDGKVDQDDITLFLQELGNQSGDILP